MSSDIQPLIQSNDITKIFNKGTESEVRALEGLSLTVYEREFVTIFGPNGSGKTTFLNIVSGIESPTKGTIQQKDNCVKIGYVFQDYNESLLPWRTVYDNIRLPLENGENGEDFIRDRLSSIITDLKLNPYINKYPYMLSGGKKQLTAIARALVTDPDLLIMDEPFSSLDYDTAYEMEQLIMRVWEKYNVTILFVSHNIDEAILLASKIVVFSATPSRIKAEFPVHIERPRVRNVIVSNDFTSIKEKVLGIYASK